MSEQLVLEKQRSALLVMDFQNDIVSRGGLLTPAEDDEDAWQRIDGAIAAAKHATDAARKAGMLVVHVAVGRQPGAPAANPHSPLLQYMLKVNALVEGTHGFDFHPDARPEPGETVIVKRGISALAGSELGPLLKGRGIDTLVLTGFATHMVIVGTAREAVDYGWRVVVLEDCCASGGQNRHDAALENLRMLCEVTDSKNFKAALGKQAVPTGFN